MSLRPYLSQALEFQTFVKWKRTTPLFILLWNTHSPSLTSTLLFPSLSLSLSFPPAICHMWENRRVINCGNQLHLFVHKLGVGWEVTPAMLLKIKTVLEVRKCCLSLQHVWSVSAPIRTPIFTPHLLNPSTPKHATILHQHAPSAPISCTLSFCPIS